MSIEVLSYILKISVSIAIADSACHCFTTPLFNSFHLLPQRGSENRWGGREGEIRAWCAVAKGWPRMWYCFKAAADTGFKCGLHVDGILTTECSGPVEAKPIYFYNFIYAFGIKPMLRFTLKLSSQGQGKARVCHGMFDGTGFLSWLSAKYSVHLLFMSSCGDILLVVYRFHYFFTALRLYISNVVFS